MVRNEGLKRRINEHLLVEEERRKEDVVVKYYS